MIELLVMRTSMLEIPLLCALLAGLGPGQQDSAAKQENPLDQLRRDLRSEGVEARKKREHAVGGLLLRKELRAHMILQKALGRPQDPDHLVPFILDQLEKKWAQVDDPVFGDQSRLRLELLKSYASVIVRLLPIEDRDHRDAQEIALEEKVVACLRDSIRQEERMQVFMFLLDQPDTGRDIHLMSAAMYAAAGCRDMRLIPLLAKFLDDPELRIPAQLALREKIVRPELFADRREFTLWWEKHKAKTNIELIEGSARSNLAKINEIREELTREQRALILKLVDYSARSGDWLELVEILAEPSNVDSLEAYLTKLREALRQVPVLGGVRAERFKLVERMHEFLPRSESGVRALVLENLAYLVIAEDGDSYVRVDHALRDALFSDQPAESTAAFRGIQRFFSVENRNQVVLAASASQNKGDASGLLAGLHCLSSAGWRSPGADDQDFSLWLDLLQRVFADEESDHAAKEAAIDVALTAADTPETGDRVFSLLLANVLGEQTQPARVRRYALDNLPSFVAEAPARERAYMEAVSALLADADVQMRKRAAEVLGAKPFADFPEKTRKEWVPKIVVLAVSRFGEETDEKVLEEIVDLMVWMNDQPGGNNVVGRLRAEAAKLTQQGTRTENAVLRRVLKKGLAILGGTIGSDLAQWVTAGEALLDLNDRPGLRRVLDTHQIVNLQGSADDEWSIRAFRMVIDAARIRPLEAPWEQAEAIELEHAFAELEQLGVLQERDYDHQGTRFLRLAALASRGMHDQVVTLGVSYLGDSRLAFEPAQEVQVRVMIARAFLANGNGTSAENQLEKISAPADSAAELTQLWLDVASHYATAKEWDHALRVLGRQFTSQASSRYRDAFLLRMECELAKQPGQAAEVLGQLQAEAQMFQVEGTPDELVKRYQALLVKASKG